MLPIDGIDRPGRPPSVNMNAPRKAILQQIYPSSAVRASYTSCIRAMLALMAFVSFVVVAPVAARASELVMFESPGCPWCARWRAEVGPGYPLSEEGRRAPLRIHTVTDSATAGVRLKAPVTASPTFVLVDNGSEVGRIVGYPGPDFFWGLLSQMLVKLDRASKL